MQEKIHIAFTIDKPYIQHVGVLLCSLFEHNPKNLFIIYLVIDFSENHELKKLKKFIATFSQELKVINVQKEKVSGFKLSHHATSAVYYRLLLPELLDYKIEKILYLDADMIIKNDLLSLWNIDLKSYPLAAVKEPLFNRHAQLGLIEGTPYFNSGVMLMNLPVWREMKVSELAMHFIRDYPERISFWDQDGLNAVLQGDWLELDFKWNQQSQMYQASCEIIESSQMLEDALADPAIIHFSSKFKPWQYWCDHPLKDEYYKYLNLTPWKNFSLQEDSLWHLLKQRVKRAINKIVGKELFEIYA